MMRRELTGRDVLFVTVAAFAVIIGVNLLLAWKAVSTFPGLEVRNSYVASQTFDAERRAQEALGWTVTATLAGGVVAVSFADGLGGPADVATVEGLFGRTAEARDDQALIFAQVATARFEAPVRVAPGQWMLQLRATAADGTGFRQRISIPVR